MTGRFARLAGLVLAFGLTAGSAALALEPASVERGDAGKVTVRWTGADPVDVYVSARPDAQLNQAHRLARGDRDGVFEAKWAGPRRPYFILRDEADGQVVRAAERVLTLERGSNVRDVGGYPGADGKHVRWGLIYRTAAMPMLTDADYQALKSLNLRADIDLRSSEERVIAPDGVTVGRITDAVAVLGGRLPAVSAVMLQAPQGEICIPYDILEFDVDPQGPTGSGQIPGDVRLRTPLTAITPYQPNDDDLRLRRDMLDKQIVDVQDYRVVRVSDVRLAESGGRYCVVGVDASLRATLRRLGAISKPIAAPDTATPCPRPA